MVPVNLCVHNVNRLDAKWICKSKCNNDECDERKGNRSGPEESDECSNNCKNDCGEAEVRQPVNEYDGATYYLFLVAATCLTSSKTVDIKKEPYNTINA